MKDTLHLSNICQAAAGNLFLFTITRGYEAQVTARLEMWREAQRKALGITEVEHVLR